ncbi:MAG: hypothetical protein ONB47_20045 [candidate division KSB1 bacterium]|nr:hypothetical protein [candidate division KSB1 bacterium]
MLDLLRRLREQHHLTMLIVLHDAALVRQFCARTLVMHAGRILNARPEDRTTPPASPLDFEAV